MSIQITMPALSPTMEEGKLAKWLVKAGDKVEPGQVIAEIETDKATMEVEAVDEGVIAEILVPEGSQGVKVNTPIATLAGEGEAAAAKQEEALQAEEDNAAQSPPAGEGREGGAGGAPSSEAAPPFTPRTRQPPSRKGAGSAWSHRHLHGASRSRAASISPACAAAAPTAAS